MPPKKSQQKRSDDAPSPRVLIIEDDEPTLNALIIKLTAAGIPTDVARDGEEALQKIHSHAWSVIVVDILLPKTNGFSILEEIRREPLCADASVFVFTNLSGAEHRKHSLDLGAHEFIEKTKVSLSEIAKKIAAVLNKKSS